MRDVHITDCHIGHLTPRTNVRVAPMLVLGSKQNAVTTLRKTSPVVFHQIRVDQNADRILEFQVVLDDEGSTICSADEVRITWHPLPGLPKMIVQDFDIARRSSGRASAK